MKRILSLLLIFALLVALCSCAKDDSGSYRFYYLREPESVAYGTRDALIAPVIREISDQGIALNYLLRMYLTTPPPENYRSPFPSGTYLLNSLEEDNTLVVVLSEELSTLEDIHLSLAAACLCATCFDLTSAESIRILSGELTLTFDRDSFTLLDEIAPTE